MLNNSQYGESFCKMFIYGRRLQYQRLHQVSMFDTMAKSSGLKLGVRFTATIKQVIIGANWS